MKYTLPIDNDQAYDWAYENGLSPVDSAGAFRLIELISEEDFHKGVPSEIEIEFDVIPESSTAHPYGSTVAIERHSAEVTGVEVDGKAVTVPRWIEDKLMETLNNS